MLDEKVAAIGLSFVYFAMGVLGLLLARVERSVALRMWSNALFCFALDEAAASVYLFVNWVPFRLFSWSALIAGAILALAGTLRLLGRRLAKTHIAGLLGALTISVLGGVLGIDAFYLSCVVFTTLAVPFFWAATLFWRLESPPGIGHRLSAFAFALVGVYAVTWPYIEQVGSIKRFEFFFDLTVVMWSAAGVCLLHFERGRARIQQLAQQELELRAKLETSERLEALGRLAGGVAHDFNNVLTTVIHGSELVLRQIEDRPKAAAHLRLVLEAAQGAAQFTRQLLALGRRRLPGRKAVVLNDAVNSALRMVKPSLSGEVTLSVKVPDVDVTVNSAEGQLEQIIVNLSLNAIDAMPDGGKLEVEVTFDPIEQQAHLLVSDTGFGIEKDVLSHIFEPFFSTKQGNSGVGATGVGVGSVRQSGTGLGLAAVYAIVKQLDGQIDVTSVVGEKTVFAVALPAKMGRSEVGRTTERSVVPDTLSVLVVDDQATVLRSIANGLEAEGYQVFIATSAMEALQLAKNQRFSLVLTDLCMPMMDGIELVKQLRDVQVGLPAIIMTAYSRDAEADSGRFDARWLPKPFTPAQLRKEIATVIKASSSQQLQAG
jgi:signal transduction histidine kinase